jgi:ABC-type methionine transport system permease subunit
MAGTVRPPGTGALVACGTGDLVGLKRPASGPRISVTFWVTMRSNWVSNMAWLTCMIVSGMVLSPAFLERLVEACLSTGAGTWQVLTGAVFVQARPSFVRGVVLTIISLIGSSAMVGTIGAGGIGDMAIQFGYNRYETGVLIAIVVVLIVIVQIIQWLGDWVARRLTH